MIDNAEIVNSVIKDFLLYSGIGTTVVVGLSSWLGKVWASRILTKQLYNLF